jgi:putative NADPH-quinone reductase
MKKILVVLGHPNNDSFCGELAARYADGARKAGAEVQTLRLADLEFDPTLHLGYKTIQELEPDLLRAQELITWAEHLAVVYPIWWGTMPALLKGFLDRALLPGFAFKYREDSPLWDKLLKGRSARVIVTSDAPVWYNFLMNGNPAQKAMKKTILEFCGFKPVRIKSIGSVKTLTRDEIAGWLETAENLGRKLN